MHFTLWKQRDRETERQRDGETERRRDGETERQRDRETERQRDRETERQRDTLEITMSFLYQTFRITEIVSLSDQ